MQSTQSAPIDSVQGENTAASNSRFPWSIKYLFDIIMVTICSLAKGIKMVFISIVERGKGGLAWVQHVLFPEWTGSRNTAREGEDDLSSEGESLPQLLPYEVKNKDETTAKEKKKTSQGERGFRRAAFQK